MFGVEPNFSLLVAHNLWSCGLPAFANQCLLFGAVAATPDKKTRIHMRNDKMYLLLILSTQSVEGNEITSSKVSRLKLRIIMQNCILTGKLKLVKTLIPLPAWQRPLPTTSRQFPEFSYNRPQLLR